MDTSLHDTVAVFGATGTIGDGLLKAALEASDVSRVHVVTRRASPRIEAAARSGKVVMTIHNDYANFSEIQAILADVDAVYWAIGLSSSGMDEATYRKIHVQYPLALVSEWLKVAGDSSASFHYVSGSGANAESRMMWAREKALAESELAKMASSTNLRVISYRPSIILPTETEAHIGHKLLYSVLAPIKSAVAAEAIGKAMLEVSAYGQCMPNGTILENADILEFAQARDARLDDE